MFAKAILIINDADLLARWRAELDPRGWTVFVASDVSSAIDLAIRQQPHVFIISLSDISGHHLLRTLRSAVEHDVKVVGILDRESEPDSLKAAGFDVLVERSTDFDVLHRSLAVDEDDTERRPTTSMPALKP
jgi:DNA-binding response OmpR family regulator